MLLSDEFKQMYQEVAVKMALSKGKMMVGAITKEAYAEIVKSLSAEVTVEMANKGLEYLTAETRSMEGPDGYKNVKNFFMNVVKVINIYKSAIREMEKEGNFEVFLVPEAMEKVLYDHFTESQDPQLVAEFDKVWKTYKLKKYVSD